MPFVNLYIGNMNIIYLFTKMLIYILIIIITFPKSMYEELRYYFYY